MSRSLPSIRPVSLLAAAGMLLELPPSMGFAQPATSAAKPAAAPAAAAPGEARAAMLARLRAIKPDAGAESSLAAVVAGVEGAAKAGGVLSRLQERTLVTLEGELGTAPDAAKPAKRQELLGALATAIAAAPERAETWAMYVRTLRAMPAGEMVSMFASSAASTTSRLSVASAMRGAAFALEALDAENSPSDAVVDALIAARRFTAANAASPAGSPAAPGAASTAPPATKTDAPTTAAKPDPAAKAAALAEADAAMARGDAEAAGLAMVRALQAEMTDKAVYARGQQVGEEVHKLAVKRLLDDKWSDYPRLVALAWQLGARAMDESRSFVDLSFAGMIDAGTAQSLASWHQRLSEAGHVRATLAYASHLSYGIGVVEDDAEAMRWNTRAADAGDGEGLVRVAMSKANNPTEAMQWYKRAADAGSASAMNMIGIAYMGGRGVTKDMAEAVRWFRRASEAGSSRAMINMAWRHRDGQGLPRDLAETARWYRKAAEAGFSSGMYNVFVVFAGGEGVPQDSAEARRWLRRAAEGGMVEAMRELGSYHRTGQYGVAKDTGESNKWFALAAEAGGAAEMVQIGRLFLARDAMKDPEEAEKWFERAVQKHGPTALDTIADAFAGERYGQHALRLYKRAADAGSSTAMLKIAVAYFIGERAIGLPQDRAAGRDWLERAAQHGGPSVMNCIGLMFYNPKPGGNPLRVQNAGLWASLGIEDEVENPQEQALAWFRRSAEAGDIVGMRLLGRLLYDTADEDATKTATAIDWLTRAAEKNDTGAMASLFAIVDDDKLRIKWLKRAAEREDCISMMFLAGLYLGDDMKDFAQAEDWLKRAGALIESQYRDVKYFESIGMDLELAQAGLRQFAFEMGQELMLRSERGDPVFAAGEATAIEWLRKAARMESVEAQDVLKNRNLTW